MNSLEILLEGLNSPQKEAVLHTEGPLLVFAGAGSGKTRVITHRVAYLIAKGVLPEKILAVTFTNKAAGEMRERVKQLLKAPASSFQLPASSVPWIGTFHSLGAFILREEGQAIGIPRSFSILDEDDALKVVKEVLKKEGVELEYYAPPRVRSLISWIKTNEPDMTSLDETLRLLFASYEKALAQAKSLDFDDLLEKTVRLFREHPAIVEHYQKRWQYVHIDEYQDTNHLQYLLGSMLAKQHGNIAVVGDDDQAIYSWRGADWRNILSFKNDWPEVKVVALEENYRSSPSILQAANAVIARNAARHPKQLWTKKKEGPIPCWLTAGHSTAEAQYIAFHILTLFDEGKTPHDIAILFRTNAQSRALEEALIAVNIPYKLVSGTKFYERKEIKDLLAYARYALNPSDRIALARIINTPPRGIGKALQVKYFAYLAHNLPAQAGRRNQSFFSPAEYARVEQFEKLCEKIRGMAQTKHAYEMIKKLIVDIGFTDYLAGEKNGEERIENVQELLAAARRYDEFQAPESTQKLLEEATLMSEQDGLINRGDQDDKGDKGKIPLMTVHAAKGLEFDVVFVTGLEEGLFPHALSQEPHELEEERRLFYVALTRARERVILTSSRARFQRGELTFSDPSRFLSEIPPHLLEVKEARDVLPTIQL